MKRFWVLLMLFVCLCAPALAQPASFTATGVATVPVETDGVAVTLRICASADDLAKAEALADQSVSALKSAVMSVGVQAADVSLSRVDAQNVSEYHYSKLQQPSLVIIGSSVVYEMKIVLYDAEKANALVDAIVSTGMYESYELTPLASGRDETYRQALSLAVADGMEKALLVAKACGVTDAELVSVVENEPQTDGQSVTAVVTVTLRTNE